MKTCKPALGYSFAAGTTDGPGAFDFKQGKVDGCDDDSFCLECHYRIRFVIELYNNYYICCCFKKKQENNSIECLFSFLLLCFCGFLSGGMGALFLL